jgi:hypothetical protein
MGNPEQERKRLFVVSHVGASGCDACHSTDGDKTARRPHLLIAGVGLSALAVCRRGFEGRKRPGFSDVAPFLFSEGE